MRVLATGDWHGDWMTSGVDRFPEVERAVGETTAHAIRERVDLYVFDGDLADPDNMRSHRASAMAIRAMRVLSQNGVRSIWIPGNHDVVEDGTFSTTLASLRAAAEFVPKMAYVCEHPAAVHLAPDFSVLCLPYTARAAAYDPAKVLGDWSGLVPKLVVGHMMLPEATVGSETTEMPRGRDVEWPVEEIRRRWPGAVMIGGHLHTPQVTSGIHFPGNLCRLTHGEEQNRPGFIVMDIP